MSSGHRPLRTRFYIDGYNLYYGCLRGTRHKWLDLRALCAKILSQVNFNIEGEPAAFNFDDLSIKYFTAPILANFARAKDSVPCQTAYHEALRGQLGPSIEIIHGYYDARPAKAHRYIEKQPARDCELVEIWKLEEKQSDVALSLHAFMDALDGVIDHAVVVSNDTDIVPSLKLIRERTNARIGLVVPTRSTADGRASKGMPIGASLPWRTGRAAILPMPSWPLVSCPTR